MYEFTYIICDTADETIFNKQCIALEKHIPMLKKGELIEDVDGSLFQEYTYFGKMIIVKNSYYHNEVRIDSEIELTQFFN